MKYTPKLGLKKPDQNDYVNIQDLNDNFDVLDNAEQIIQSDTEPEGVEEGRLWLDTSDDFYQATAFENLVQSINDFAEHIRIDKSNSHQISNIEGLENVLDTLEKIRSSQGKPLTLEVRKNDPVNPEVGRIWIREDL